MTKDKPGSIRPIKFWWEGILIILDFILFYFTFFHTFWKWIDDNKGIPFTVFMFVTMWIIYLRIPKNKIDRKN